MKLYKPFAGLLVYLILISVPSESKIISKETGMNVANAALPALAGLVTLCVLSVPLGPLLVVGLGILHIATMLMLAPDDEIPPPTLTNLDLKTCQKEIMNEIKNVDSHIVEQSDRVIRELKYTIESQEFFEDMRNTLEYMERICSDETEVVLNNNLTGLQKISTLNLMMDPHSFFRNTIRYFVTKFIKPRFQMYGMEPVKLFFEFVIEKEILLASQNDNYQQQETLHNRVFLAYMSIAKILTDSYVLPVAAESIQYQKLIKENKTSDAVTMKRDALHLLNDYKTDMKALINQTKWALNKASREIRNTERVNVKKSGDVKRLQFVRLMPKVSEKSGYKCLENPTQFNPAILELGDCQTYGDKLPKDPMIKIAWNWNNVDRPYYYMDLKSNNGDGKFITYGRKVQDYRIFETGLIRPCKLLFCSVIKKNAVGISVEYMKAKPGYVIVGLQFRVEDNILYLDIQQGKYISMVEVDQKTVHWTRTPPGGNVIYLTGNLRSLQVGNFELLKNRILTGVGLQAEEHSINVHFGGFLPSDGTTMLQGTFLYFPKHEFKISGDDPTYGNGIPTITKFPEKASLLFIKFQHSSLEEDFGRTTIPFIDTRKVVSNPPAPLAGFGIYHAANGNGGFISLKLITPDLSILADYQQIEKFIEVAKDSLKKT